MHSCPGKMRGLEYQLAVLTDVVETPSDASDHGSFPVASAWPKLPQLARAGQSNRQRAGTGSASPERATRPPLWPAGMAEGNRETFRHRVGLSSHGSPAKGGPKSKCLARVKIARTSAGPPNLTISDPSRFPALVIFKLPTDQPDQVDVIVVWEAWKSLPTEARSEVVRDAYDRFARVLESSIHQIDPSKPREPLVPTPAR